MKKFLVISTIVGALFLGGTMGAFAASNSKTLEVFFNIKDIKINQVPSMPDQKPFTHQGTTYVPLRYISEELRYPVKWDKENQTIHIGETLDDSAYYLERDIPLMNFQRETSIYENFAFVGFNETIPQEDNIGNKYANYLILGLSNASDDQWTLTEFALNGQYSTFETTFSLTGDSKSTSSLVTFEVYLDEELVETYIVKAGQMPEEIKINTKNANKIGFKLSFTDRGSSARVGLFEPKFYK